MSSDRDSSAALSRLCDVKGCGKEATERVVEREKPHIGVPVCATHAFALTLGDFYIREVRDAD